MAEPFGFVPVHVHDVIAPEVVVAPPFRNAGSPSATFSFAIVSANGPALKLTRSSSMFPALSVTRTVSWSRPWVVRFISAIAATSGNDWKSEKRGRVRERGARQAPRGQPGLQAQPLDRIRPRPAGERRRDRTRFRVSDEPGVRRGNHEVLDEYVDRVGARSLRSADRQLEREHLLRG